MLDETVETRRPWRGSPCPAIRGRAFLCIVCIIQQYLGSFAIRSRKRACPSRSHGIKPLTLWQKKKKFDDKAPPLCYNQLKALYFCKRHHITIFYRCTPLWRGQTTSHHSTKDMEVFNALITNQQQENWNAVCRQNAKNAVRRQMNAESAVETDNAVRRQMKYTVC